MEGNLVIITYRDYLSGDKLDTSLKVQITDLIESSDSDLLGRNSFLADLVRGTSVIHIGCADHLEVIKKKIKLGNYLHSILLEVCTNVIGVDSNIAGLSAMKELGFDPKTLIADYELGNIDDKFKFALIPDVIEHIHNVGDFLFNIKNLNVKHFVFSTPNGLSLENRLLLNIECVNSDHLSYFTPYTLAKSLTAAGYTITSIHLVDLLLKRRPMRSLLLKHFPLLREHLIVVASKQ